jgi:hypothetical protein
MGNDTTTTGEDPIVDVKIDPLDPIVIVKDGVIPPALQFTAIGITDKGVEVPVTGSWKYDRPDLATIGGGSGEFTATGLLGGVGLVTFDSQGLSASTNATVKLYFTDDPGVDPGIKDAFDGAFEPDPAMTLLYPYDKTVFPRGLVGPRIQWNGGGANDLYYVHVVAETFEFEGWKAVPPPSRYDFPLLPNDVWLKLTASTDGEVKFDIQRYDGNKAYLAKTQTWTIAPADLAGTVYYWEVNNGNIVRLPVGASNPENFIKKDGNTQCLACHSVSRDGSRIAAAAQGGWSPWNTINSATGDILYYSATASGFQAISPNGSHTLWGQSDERRPAQAQHLQQQRPCSRPAQRPGRLASCTPPGPVTATSPSASKPQRQLARLHRSEPVDHRGRPRQPQLQRTKKIVDKMPGPLSHDLPDLQPRLASGSPTTAATRPAPAPPSRRSGSPRLDGSAQVRLDQANGKGIIEIGQDQTTYEPTFLPCRRRRLLLAHRRLRAQVRQHPHRHQPQQPPQAAVGHRDRRQRPRAASTPRTRPSGCPGQELNNSNMRGEWALAPCKADRRGLQGRLRVLRRLLLRRQQRRPAPDLRRHADTCSHLGDSCELDAACCEGEG